MATNDKWGDTIITLAKCDVDAAVNKLLAIVNDPNYMFRDEDGPEFTVEKVEAAYIGAIENIIDKIILNPDEWFISTYRMDFSKSFSNRLIM